MTQFQAIALIFFIATGGIAAVFYFVCSLFPYTEDDATDPYMNEYPGASAPREDV